MKCLGSQTQLSKCFSLLSLLLSILVVEAADVCAPVTWTGTLRRASSNVTDTITDTITANMMMARRDLLDPDDLQPGDINCRYTGRTDAAVNYYTCTQLANFYGITIEKFFKLNPQVKPDCSNILPSSVYCVDGFIEPVRATDGLCGPKNNNATCLGQSFGQCCNAATWKCGNTTDDCAPGNCYEGACVGDNIFSTDGTCGYQHGYRQCIGKWGSCCNMDGTCGNGTAFCGIGSCQMGNCTQPAITTPPTTGNTTDGTCGGPKSLTCNLLYGTCCNKYGQCGSLDTDCGVGCQPKYGQCSSISSSSTTIASSTKSSSTISSTKSSSSVPTATPVSLDGKCGSASTTGATCAGSSFGSCCSVRGNCGSTPAFCAVSNLCQPKFGTCTPVALLALAARSGGIVEAQPLFVALVICVKLCLELVTQQALMDVVERIPLYRLLVLVVRMGIAAR
ncbi:uncharacterized protein PAC_19461 [Phialocephala subalpina]|uniref:Carbohydrate-binding module family 18 protein n=1 Tax=Phialocephala subalpina TaxID=576137 RepID=A0A1L7XWY0_9HELO|nr:uncharacterized protein PAC_19461 [Phialocephala subalpina]